MDKGALETLLAAACDVAKDSTYNFTDAQEASLMVALDGALLNVAKLRRVRLEEGFVVVDGDRETLYLDSATIMGVRVKDAAPEGTGFIKG